MVMGSTATLLRDGRVLVTGYFDTGELYDPVTRTWRATGKMTKPRHSHVAILLSDGKVLVAGGHAPDDQPTHSAELYDPETGTWTAIANMQAQREAIEAFLQPDGTVLVVGGSGRGEPQSVETIRPGDRGMDRRRGSVQDRARSSARLTTLLSDGQVLVTDGHVRFRRSRAVRPELPSPGPARRPCFGRTERSGDPAARWHGPRGRWPLTVWTGKVNHPGTKAQRVCIATASAELYVPRGVSPPMLSVAPDPDAASYPDSDPDADPVPARGRSGPVRAARTWTVNVQNHSSDPATLFEAEEDESGLAGLCGKVTPNVVPPHTTIEVTFLLPPKEREELLDLGQPDPWRGRVVLPDVRRTHEGRVRHPGGRGGGLVGPVGVIEMIHIQP